MRLAWMLALRGWAAAACSMVSMAGRTVQCPAACARGAQRACCALGHHQADHLAMVQNRCLGQDGFVVRGGRMARRQISSDASHYAPTPGGARAGAVSMPRVLAVSDGGEDGGGEQRAPGFLRACRRCRRLRRGLGAPWGDSVVPGLLGSESTCHRTSGVPGGCWGGGGIRSINLRSSPQPSPAPLLSCQARFSRLVSTVRRVVGAGRAGR